MGERTGISWTDRTFNPWIGCTKVSPACTNCYAEVNRFVAAQRAGGRELWGPDAQRHVTSDANWREPLKWNREAERLGVRLKVFCASLADVFEDRHDLAAPRARLWALVLATPHLDWQLLTKRPENAARLWEQAKREDYFGTAGPTWQSNVWLGVTVEDRKRAGERIPHLLEVPAAVRFLSVEPMLSDVHLDRWLWRRCSTCHGSKSVPVPGGGAACSSCFDSDGGQGTEPRGDLHWVIVGGESGSERRELDLREVEMLLRQCRGAGVAVFVKQDSSARPGARGRLSDELWALKQFPTTRAA